MDNNGPKILFWVIAILIVVLLAVSVYIIFFEPQQAPQTNSQNAPVSSQTQPSQQASSSPMATQPTNTQNIAIMNFSFNPASISVPAGTTIIWTNYDPVPHKIKSNTFNSTILNMGNTFSFELSQTGTYNYSCAIHPYMSGQIIVQ